MPDKVSLEAGIKRSGEAEEAKSKGGDVPCPVSVTREVPLLDDCASAERSMMRDLFGEGPAELIALARDGDTEVVLCSTKVRFLLFVVIGDVSFRGWFLREVDSSCNFSVRTALRASMRGARPCRNGRRGVTAESMDPCLSRMS